MRAGVRSVYQTSVEEWPGRAGSVCTAGAGPSARARERPFASSMVTSLRTGFTQASFCFRLGSHHDERHEAFPARIGPAVPVAELHHHVTGPHDVLAVVEEQHARGKPD